MNMHIILRNIRRCGCALKDSSLMPAIPVFPYTMMRQALPFHLTMHCFMCSVVADELRLKEHEAARWLAREDLYSVDWLPEDIDVVKALSAKGF